MCDYTCMYTHMYVYMYDSMLTKLKALQTVYTEYPGQVNYYVY